MGGKRRAARGNWAARRAAIKAKYRDRKRGKWDNERKEKELRFQEEVESSSLEDSEREPYRVYVQCSLCKRTRWIDPNSEEDSKCHWSCHRLYHEYGCHCNFEPHIHRPCWICVKFDRPGCAFCDPDYISEYDCDPPDEMYYYFYE